MFSRFCFKYGLTSLSFLLVVESTLDEPPQHKPAAKEADGKPKSLIKKKSSQPTGATRELAEQTNRKAKADERYSPVHHVEYHGRFLVSLLIKMINFNYSINY